MGAGFAATGAEPQCSPSVSAALVFYGLFALGFAPQLHMFGVAAEFRQRQSERMFRERNEAE